MRVHVFACACITYVDLAIVGMSVCACECVDGGVII